MAERHERGSIGRSRAVCAAGIGGIMNDQPLRPAGNDRDVNRRTLLRRGGVIVAATVAGVTAVEALNAGDAQGAPGDPLVLGQANDSGTALTSLTGGATTGATLTVA